MPDFKEWPFIGRVIGALAAVAVLFGPLLVTAFSLGSTANSLRNQREREESHYVDTTRRLEAQSEKQDKISEKVDELSNILLRAGYENTSRFSDLERRVNALETSRVIEPR